jgi:hypothetical protein
MRTKVTWTLGGSELERASLCLSDPSLGPDSCPNEHVFKPESELAYVGSG